MRLIVAGLIALAAAAFSWGPTSANPPIWARAFGTMCGVVFAIVILFDRDDESGRAKEHSPRGVMPSRGGAASGRLKGHQRPDAQSRVG